MVWSLTPDSQPLNLTHKMDSMVFTQSTLWTHAETQQPHGHIGQISLNHRDLPQGLSRLRNCEITLLLFCCRHHYLFQFQFRNIQAWDIGSRKDTCSICALWLQVSPKGLIRIPLCSATTAITDLSSCKAQNCSPEQLLHPTSSSFAACRLGKGKAEMTASIAMKQCQFTETRIRPLKKNNPIYHHLAVTSLFCSNAKVCKVLNKSKWEIIAVKTTQGQWQIEHKSEGERLKERYEALKQWGKMEE